MKTGRREARMETRDAQHQHRIFDERLGDMPQHARLEIAHAAEWINQCAMLVLGNRIDGEIAATQIVFKRDIGAGVEGKALRSEEHTSELQPLMRISYAVFCLKKKLKVYT